MKFTNKQIWQIAYPILISLAMEHMIGLTDTAFLGRVGEAELGASALAGVYYLAIYMLGFGFSIGAQILIARRNGEGKYREIGAIFRQGVVFLAGLAAVMFCLSRILSPRLLPSLIESPQVARATIDYLNWRVYGFFFSYTAVMFRAFYVGTTRTKILTLNSVVMVLSNVVLNYALIFGKFGLPAFGIAGAAIASSAAEMISVLFFALYTWFRSDNLKYALFRFTGFSVRLLRRILAISVWTMLQSFVSMGTWFLFFLAVEHLGERELAVTNIVRSISGLGFMIISAFASTANSLVSNLMGAGEQQLVPEVTRKIIRLGYTVIVPLAVLVAFFPTLALRIYTDSPVLVSEAVPSLMVMLTSYLIHVPAFILFNAVSGTGNTRSALVMEFAALLIYVLYIGYIIVHRKADIAVCWTTEHVYAIALLILSYTYLRRGKWADKKI